MNKRFIVKLKKGMALFLLSGIMLLQIMPLTACAAEVSLPEVSFPEVSLPNVSLPTVSIPTVGIQKVIIPSVSLPTVSLPKSNSTGKTLPEVFPTGTPNSSAQGQPSQGANLAKTAPSASILDSDGYKITKFMYGLGVAHVTLADKVTSVGNNLENLNVGNVLYKFYGGMARGGLGLLVPTDSYGKLGVDTWQGVDYGRDIKTQYQKFQAAKALLAGTQRAENVSEVARGADAVSNAVNVVRPLSKLATGLAVAGVVVSGAEAIYNGVKAFNSDNSEVQWKYGMKSVGNVGQAMMSGAILLSAACPPAAMAMAAVGGVLWAGSALYANKKKIGEAANWVANTLGNSAVGKAIANSPQVKVIKGVFKFAQGLFS